MDKIFDEIEKDIEKHKFTPAEGKLKEIMAKSESEEEVSRANMLLGKIYSFSSKSKASAHLLDSIHSAFPEEQAFALYAQVEEDKNIAMNYLEFGLEYFPHSAAILKEKLVLSSGDEKKEIVRYCVENKVFSHELLACLLMSEFEKQNWDELFSIFMAFKSEVSETRDVFDMLFIYCVAVIMGNKTELFSNVEDNLKRLIREDLRNRYCYSTYIFLAYLYLKNGDRENFYKIFKKIPVGNKIADFDGPFYIASIDFGAIYKKIFSEFSEFLKDDKHNLIVAKGLYAMYLYSQTELYYIDSRCEKKDVKALEKLWEQTRNAEVCRALFYEYREFSMDKKAFELALDMLFRGMKFEILEEVDELITSASTQELGEFKNGVISSLKERGLKNDQNFKRIVSFLTKKLHDEKMYSENAEIFDFFSVPEITAMQEGFYAAFAYAEMDKQDKASVIYEAILNKNPDNDAVINNLGVIYEHQEQFEKALNMFTHAAELAPSELHTRNVQRVTDILKKKKIQERAIKNESIAQLGANLNLDFFESIGYDKNLTSKIENIEDEKIRNVLKRDLFSSVIAIATKQYKSANILFGAIIEGVLGYALEQNGVLNYQFNYGEISKLVPLADMSFSQLLEAASAERIIDKKTYQLGSFLKDGRNIVHPSREIKDSFVFDEEKTMTSWAIVKTIIFKAL